MSEDDEEGAMFCVLRKCIVCGNNVLCSIDDQPEYNHRGCKKKQEEQEE